MNPNTTEHKFTIYLGVDGSEHSKAATRLLRDLALPEGSLVRALAVLPKRHTISRHELLAALDEFETTLSDRALDVQTGLLSGDPAEALTEFAQERCPDLLVVGAKGLRATLGVLLGGVAQQIVEYAPCPTLVVRLPYQQLHHVLLTTDGSGPSQQALSYAARFPWPKSARLHLVHVLPPPLSYEIGDHSNDQIEATERNTGQEVLDCAAVELEAAGHHPFKMLLRGDAATELLQYIQDMAVDLTISGSRGLSTFRSWLLGSVSRKLVHYSNSSVLVVK